MTWRWRAAPVAAAPADLDQVFDTQTAAEAWLTGQYPKLAGAGVRSVSLYEEDRLVYGPMSLDAAG